MLAGYHIRYAAHCHTGKVRPTNQDNLWVNGTYLQSQNEGLPALLSGKITQTPALFAVFDGMGGETGGEIAAFLAAMKFNVLQRRATKTNLTQLLPTACHEMNEAINAYAAANTIRRMGSTAAIIAFGKKQVQVCNLGDSKIFHHSGQSLAQISVDHVMHLPNTKNAPLTQHLGIRREDFALTPHLTHSAYHNRDKYLLCSDGLTDMVNPDEINEILNARATLNTMADTLLKRALENGGRDNITLILCEILKRSWF